MKILWFSKNLYFGAYGGHKKVFENRGGYGLADQKGAIVAHMNVAQFLVPSHPQYVFDTLSNTTFFKLSICFSQHL